MTIALTRVVNEQTLPQGLSRDGSILLDKIDKSQGNSEQPPYAQVHKQKLYVPYSNPEDLAVKGYLDLVPTDEILLQLATSGSIGGLESTVPPCVSVSIIQSNLIAKSVISAAIHDSAGSIMLLGSNTAASVDTSTNDVLRIRTNATSAYTVITVTSGATTAKSVIASDLNTAFATNSLALTAFVVAGTNQIQISSGSPNIGINALIDIDTIANGSTLNTPVGFVDGATINGTLTFTINGTTLNSLSPDRTRVYLTDLSGNVQIIEQAGFSSLSSVEIIIPTASVVGTVAVGWKSQVFANSKYSNTFIVT